ncbi:MAG: hypothetical protein HY350_05225, partial [Candidatus Omnitrophica bacterium]|nr:hypothetical protein [Candidatus Omnitrophota bacterium]
MYFSLLIISLLLLNTALADDLKITNSFESGEKSLSDVFDEEEDDTSFTYWKSSSKIENERKNGARYYFSASFQEKDYAERNLDNDT